VAVQIAEVEVVPRSPGEAPATTPPPPAPGAQAPSPELAHEIERTVALHHARSLRLHAD
jgi:hypothetical protein